MEFSKGSFLKLHQYDNRKTSLLIRVENESHFSHKLLFCEPFVVCISKVRTQNDKLFLRTKIKQTE